MDTRLKPHRDLLQAAQETDVTTLIPHRGTMLRIDQLLYIDEVCARAAWTVQPEDPFLEDGILARESLIETAAQTVAAAQGWIAKEAGEPNPEGLLIGMESFVFHGEVAASECVTVFVEKQVQKSSLLLVHCTLDVEERIVAEGVLKFYVA